MAQRLTFSPEQYYGRDRPWHSKPTRRGHDGTEMNSSMACDEDETEALAARNARLMIRQGATPEEAAAIVGYDLRALGLCPGCGRERKGYYATCGRTACVKKAQTGRPPGTPATPESRAAHGQRLRGRRLSPEHRRAISEGMRRRSA